ncbi:hypothetical protein HWV07_04200 [Natronomonas salina]|uniref:DUF7288 family protein n=1 Tax=Natronomonas salina TaxID=1710540 RepID=UPI0015B3AFF3|nr:hypothetical protein HWV07_04200 [Natronomonas salina]
MRPPSQAARGQAYTLEAFIAALLLVASLTFALQVTAVTPLSASTANQHIENQQRSSAVGLLAAADENSSLKEAVLYWDRTENTFHGTTGMGYYTNGYSENTFGKMVDRAYGDRGLAVNIIVHVENQTSPQRMVYHGEPSDNAASASRRVTLYDDDSIRAADGTTDVQLSTTDEFYAPDAHPGSDVYNVVRVEVIVWRM